MSLENVKSIFELVEEIKWMWKYLTSFNKKVVGK